MAEEDMKAESNGTTGLQFPSVKEAVNIYGDKVQSKSKKLTAGERLTAAEEQLASAREDIEHLKLNLAHSANEKQELLHDHEELKKLAQETAKRLEVIQKLNHDLEENLQNSAQELAEIQTLALEITGTENIKEGLLKIRQELADSNNIAKDRMGKLKASQEETLRLTRENDLRRSCEHEARSALEEARLQAESLNKRSEELRQELASAKQSAAITLLTLNATVGAAKSSVQASRGELEEARAREAAARSRFEQSLEEKIRGFTQVPLSLLQKQVTIHEQCDSRGIFIESRFHKRLLPSSSRLKLGEAIIVIYKRSPVEEPA